MMKTNKNKILILILESDKKCTEEIYFKLLQKIYGSKLPYIINVYKIGPTNFKNKISMIGFISKC